MEEYSTSDTNQLLQSATDFAYYPGKHRQVQEDRISNLPSLATERILEFLPLQEAVKISVVSTHWRNQWTQIPNLILDEHFFTYLLLKYVNHHQYPDQFGPKYLHVINNVLLRHIGDIRKLVLYVPTWLYSSADINHWIQFVCVKGVQEFTLYDGRSTKTKLPSCLLSTVGLRSLVLIDCSFPSLPRMFSGFPSLANLFIRGNMEHDVLETIISSSPKLFRLALDLKEFNVPNLTIQAPMLCYLDVNGSIDSIHLKGTNKIKTLLLRFSWRFKKELSNFFLCLSNVVSLTLDGNFWKSCHGEGIPKLSNKLLQLTTLKLSGIPTNCVRAMSFSTVLLTSSPHVQELRIKVAKPNCNPCGTVRLEINEDIYWLQHLATARVCITGLSHDLELIRFLLAHSPVLQVMTIELHKAVGGAEHKLYVATELMRYRRASTNAEIVFKG